MSRGSPNIAFLLDCCRPTPSVFEGHDNAWANLDFDWIAEAAQRHGVLPLVARRLALSSVDQQEGSAVRQIVRKANALALRNQYMVEQLAIVVERLGRAGIETLVVKGPAIARLAYRDVGLRFFGDLDLLIHPGDVPAAARELESLGLVSMLYDEESFTSGFFDAVEANFHRDDDRTNIDLHWDLMPRAFALGPVGAGLWQHTRTIELNGMSIRTLANEEHFLYLTVHSARHGWVSLGQVCDLACFVAQEPIDWMTVERLAKATHCTRILAVALWLVQELLGATLPAGASALLQRNERARTLAQAIARDLAADEGVGSITRVRRTLSLIDQPFDRVRYLAITSFAPTLMDRQFTYLPRRLYPLYFFVRPLRAALTIVRRKR